MSLLRSALKQLILLLFFFTLCETTQAQAPKKPDAAEILLGLKKLNVLGSALYVAAHPDDENTALIAWLANEKLVNTGYLSLTRGDGGQNLIGPEIRERLGIIRTQELLQARRTDGGQQFFTRANDFGFSKDYQETLTLWDKEQVLADMVWTIRKVKPDVMITRFSTEPGGTHGHHTTSAILASEAFDAAADPKRFPEQLKYVSVWQPKRILWNTSSFFYKDKNFDPTGKLQIETSTFNPVLGEAYTEISATSRSMHKSQGFGSGPNYGKVTDYLEPIKGSRAQKDLFEGIDLSWNRVSGGKTVGKMAQKLVTQFDANNPAASIPALLNLKTAIEKLPENPYKAAKLAEIQELVKFCAGLFFETTAAHYAATPGEKIELTAVAVNRSAAPVTLEQVSISPISQQISVNKLLTKELQTTKATVALPADFPVSQPYWLQQPGTEGMFAVADQQLIGLPENPAPIHVTFSVKIHSVSFQYTVPVVYKRVDPVAGEIYRPFAVTPPVFVSLAENVYMFTTEKPREIQVRVRAGKENCAGQVALQVPAGWRTEPASAAFNLKLKDEEQLISFNVFPGPGQTDAQFRAIATLDDKTYDKSLVTIQYEHIPTQVLFPEATARAVKIDLQRKGQQIGYIAGPGDEVPVSLRQIGYTVMPLQNEELNQTNLRQFDAVVIGVRAFNTNNYLKFAQPVLMEYVKNGGTLVVQYNTNHALVTENLGPYPLKLSRDRVTVENAEVRLLKPEHPVLNYPNKITANDFAGWVQERGLYFPNEWDKNYEAILSSNDPGEPARDGGLLVAKYGKGYYVYTGYSFFRQLPAGVPGAYRLFTNLISLGKK
ncbi:PIG-L family deacetylase [Adhaeribacter sp. BT258]|uniref:PIG-L family deacetylase n=1 Tax=Adhaeribacter terrigena TaxID=2793070 RepID=A0ABS1C1P8_9BACT|nr:PIG-L family deacetylase [Adhaeribacter terrigena]MBK0402485.1 PIG-L family deacetylase [Adhaeribacter terrigena]